MSMTLPDFWYLSCQAQNGRKLRLVPLIRSTNLARLIEEEVWTHRPKILTNAAQLVLMRLADSAGRDHRMVWIGEATLITDTRNDRSTVYDALYQLERLNIVIPVPKDEWPVEARKYHSVVRKINPVSEWAVVYQLDGQDIAQDTSRSVEEWRDYARRKRRTSGMPTVANLPIEPSENQTVTVGKSDPNQEPNQELKTEETTSLPSRSRATKRPSRKRSDEDQGLDPADVIALFPEPAPQPTSGRRPGPDTGMGLVDYFEQALRATHAGRKALLVPDPINRTAMAATLNRWKRTGSTPDQIRAWIITYADSCGSRAAGAPPWKDFLARRAKLALQEAAQAEADVRHNPDHPDFAAYWGLTPDEAAALTAPLEAA